MKTLLEIIYRRIFPVLIIITLIGCERCDDEEIIENVLPQVKTRVSYFTYTQARIGGEIIVPGTQAVTNYGVCWKQDSLPQDSIPTVFDNNMEKQGYESEFFFIINIAPSTKYFIRAYVKNLTGIHYGETLTIISDTAPLRINTGEILAVTDKTATVSGIILNDDGYNISSYGVAVSQNAYGTGGILIPGSNINDDFVFSVEVLDLIPCAQYYVRAYAVSANTTIYGEIIGFVTKHETISDIDGNVYRIIRIGDQYWTVDNFRAEHFRDGTPIPIETEDACWAEFGGLTSPAMCWYDNNKELYNDPYGALYNFYVASHPLIAPEGWRVPTYNDFYILVHLLNYYTVPPSGGKMKEAGTAHWQAPNTGANNESGFTALPGGIRFRGVCQAMGTNCLFWNNEAISAGPLFTELFYNNYITNIDGITSSKSTGMSLRLVKE